MPKPKSKGFIILPREFQSHAFYSDEPFTKTSAFLDLLFLANYKPSHFFVRGVKVDVGVGQLAISQETLARKWLWTRPRVFRFLNYLESERLVLQQKSSVITLISIVNYHQYVGRVTTNITSHVTTDVTTGVTHPKQRETKKTSAGAVSDENGFAPIQKL